MPLQDDAKFAERFGFKPGRVFLAPLYQLDDDFASQNAPEWRDGPKGTRICMIKVTQLGDPFGYLVLTADGKLSIRINS